MRTQEEYNKISEQLFSLWAKSGLLFSQVVREAIDYADQHQPSPWISVKERLPNEIGTYLILKNTENGYVDLAQYRSDWGWHNCVFNDPTYWMPIPPLEKGGEK